MRKLLLAIVLTSLPMASYSVENSACRSVGERTKRIAEARDKGVEYGKMVTEIKRRRYSSNMQNDYLTEAHRVYYEYPKNRSPESLGKLSMKMCLSGDVWGSE